MFAIGFLLFVSVIASKSSSRSGIPILLIFIVIGVIGGPEGLGKIFFNSPQNAQLLGTVALVFILFSGGLSTNVKFIRPIWKEGLVLSFAGVVIATLGMSVLIHFLLDWPWILSALLGATISSTDAAAVFGILKTKNFEIRPRIQSMIEFESGSNDPMAVFLTLTLIKILSSQNQFSWATLLTNFTIQMSLGGLLGWVCGKWMALTINWLDLEFEGLYPVLTMAGVICLYSMTEFCGGNGFLSVYLAGISMGSRSYLNKRYLIVFHDGIAWLMQVVMFLALGLLVRPSKMSSIVDEGILITLGLIFFARPLSVFLCLIWFKKYNWKEMSFISWSGLRGAVPIILATYLLVNDVPHAGVIFNLVFFVVVISLLIQGVLLEKMSQLLRVSEKSRRSGSDVYIKLFRNRDLAEIEVDEFSELAGKMLSELTLPGNLLVVLIQRRGLDFMPRANSIIELHDKLICLGDKRTIERIKDGSNGRS
ncbi:MAG: potassium/proton antiporter [Bacteriovoracaceae bacterium]